MDMRGDGAKATEDDWKSMLLLGWDVLPAEKRLAAAATSVDNGSLLEVAPVMRQ